MSHKRVGHCRNHFCHCFLLYVFVLNTPIALVDTHKRNAKIRVKMSIIFFMPLCKSAKMDLGLLSPLISVPRFLNAF